METLGDHLLPAPRMNHVCGAKTQSQVQRNTAGLQEEAESLMGRRPTPLPAQERRPDAPLLLFDAVRLS